ncbi:HAD family hydrolase [Synechococcus sp. CB0205]|jgi:putative hydrolase of the HAD superfamily|uniref:HAD family hydrolase n=1 Tax=Synechococcus sp. CB0205 TaxID=232363 RepID=UPI0002002F74|nr:HAD family hydrolase [Synechococcus sp. CB0205]
MPDLSRWVVALDLDDTLISERQYLYSGIAAVESHLESLHSCSMAGVLVAAHRNGISDLWGHACALLGLPSSVAESLLWVYRLHTPVLELLPGIGQLLCDLQGCGVQLVVLTDGRSISQRLKLQAVGLQHLRVLISEEWQSTKPSPERFLEIERLWPNRRYAAIADNPTKDFVCPNQRGWLSLGAAWCPDPIHLVPRQSVRSPADPGTEMLPDVWLSQPREVISWLI